MTNASGASSWENWTPGWAEQWAPPMNEDAEIDYSNVPPEVAAYEFVEMLTYLKVAGTLSAKMT